jgi:hypothetical protein
MNDRMNDGFRETGEVLHELTVKAREAARAGTSRRDFFERTAKLAGATAMGAAGIKLLQPLAITSAFAATAPTDTILDIVNIAATAEALAITFYTHALKHGQLHMVNIAANKNYFQAAVSQEYAHLQILESLGAKPLTTHFYFPTNMFTDQPTFFSTAVTLEEYFISAYLAAAVEFSGAYSTGIPTANLVAAGLAVQIGGIECEHKALLNVANNVTPPNNVLIESALLTSVGQATGPLTPFLAPGASGFNPVPLPLPGVDVITAIAGPYPISSFPSYSVFSPA